MKSEIKKIKIIARERQTKDGKNFISYRAVMKDGSLIDCRFRKTCNPPEKTCFIEVKSDRMNISNKYEYPRLWISEIENVIPIEFEERNNINDLF